MTFSVTAAQLSEAVSSVYSRAKAYVDIELQGILTRARRGERPFGGDPSYRIAFPAAIPVTQEHFARLAKELRDTGIDADVREQPGDGPYRPYTYLAITVH